MSSQATDPVEVFYSYSRGDEKLRDELKKHLANLKRQGIITDWYDRDIAAGKEWDDEIKKHLDSACVILLLISPDYMASDYMNDVEVKRAMERHEAGEARVIPIILRPVNWEAAPFSKLQALPSDAKAVTLWTSQDEAFLSVANGIKKALEGLRRVNTSELSSPLNISRASTVRPVTPQLENIIETRDLGVRRVDRTIDVVERFDVFLSHSHTDAEWVEDLAKQLEDQEGFHVWLDKWVLVPGRHWQQGMARGLDEADCCAVCIGEHTPNGWFKEEIQRALNRQVQYPSFRVLPLLLPNSKTVNVDDFLELRTWVDFREGSDRNYSFYQLACGIRGVSPGRWVSQETTISEVESDVEDKLRQLRRFRSNNLVDDQVALELQRELLLRHLIKGGKS